MSGPPRPARSLAARNLWMLAAVAPGMVLQWRGDHALPLQFLLAGMAALAFEAIALGVRRQPLLPYLREGSAVVQAALLVSWMPGLGGVPLLLTVFVALVLARQAFGGLGHNLFHPAAAGIAFALAAALAPLPGMVIPFISSVMREVFLTVPTRLKESAYALGSTTWEVVWDVVLPYTRSAVIGGIFLGLGRALGETMAVTFVIGNAYNISASLLDPGTSIASTIANEFGEAVDPLHKSSLLALGFLLFVLTFIVLALARLMLLQLQKRAGR